MWKMEKVAGRLFKVVMRGLAAGSSSTSSFSSPRAASPPVVGVILEGYTQTTLRSNNVVELIIFGIERHTEWAWKRSLITILRKDFLCSLRNFYPTHPTLGYFVCFPFFWVKRCKAFNIRICIIFEVQDLVWLHFDSYALIGSRGESHVVPPLSPGTEGESNFSGEFDV